MLASIDTVVRINSTNLQTSHLRAADKAVPLFFFDVSSFSLYIKDCEDVSDVGTTH